MKCTTLRMKSQVIGEFMGSKTYNGLYITESCNGEMIKVGEIPSGKIDSYEGITLIQVTKKLYQCEICKTIHYYENTN